VTARDLRALIKADLVTVYRILQSLVEAHIIREVRFKDAAIRYEYARDQHHHHTVCTACGVIEELPECTMALDASTLRRSKRFAKISEHSLEFFGICMTCARR
jgi:Fe2+ or Zn2+ uptake regulation protein